MANPSKRKPWVVQTDIPRSNIWVDWGAYRTRDDAEAHAVLARTRVPELEHRVAQPQE